MTSNRKCRVSRSPSRVHRAHVGMPGVSFCSPQDSQNEWVNWDTGTPNHLFGKSMINAIDGGRDASQS
jgi:hypothetical protein